MGRYVLIAVQLLATYLFVSYVRIVDATIWLSWAIPLALLLLIVINSVWFSRFTSWVIFAGAFFMMLVILSAFTIRWRLEDGFSSAPFYRALGMYAAMVYSSLAQIKINSRRSSS